MWFCDWCSPLKGFERSQTVRNGFFCAALAEDTAHVHAGNVCRCVLDVVHLFLPTKKKQKEKVDVVELLCGGDVIPVISSVGSRVAREVPILPVFPPPSDMLCCASGARHRLFSDARGISWTMKVHAEAYADAIGFGLHYFANAPHALNSVNTVKEGDSGGRCRVSERTKAAPLFPFLCPMVQTSFFLPN